MAGRRRLPRSSGAYTATFSRAAPTVAADAPTSIPASRGAPGPQGLAPSPSQQSAGLAARARGEPPEGAGRVRRGGAFSAAGGWLTTGLG